MHYYVILLTEYYNYKHSLVTILLLDFTKLFIFFFIFFLIKNMFRSLSPMLLCAVQYVIQRLNIYYFRFWVRALENFPLNRSVRYLGMSFKEVLLYINFEIFEQLEESCVHIRPICDFNMLHILLCFKNRDIF